MIVTTANIVKFLSLKLAASRTQILASMRIDGKLYLETNAYSRSVK